MYSNFNHSNHYETSSETTRKRIRWTNTQLNSNSRFEIAYEWEPPVSYMCYTPPNGMGRLKWHFHSRVGSIQLYIVTVIIGSLFFQRVLFVVVSTRFDMILCIHLVVAAAAAVAAINIHICVRRCCYSLAYSHTKPLSFIHIFFHCMYILFNRYSSYFYFKLVLFSCLMCKFALFDHRNER